MDKLASPIAHEHDIFVRTALSDLSIAREFFELYLPEEVLTSIDLTTLELQPTAFINDVRNESIMDLLYKVRQVYPEGDCYLIIEHQSTPDPLMPLRISQYSDLVIQYHLDNSEQKLIPMVYSLVIYHGIAKECCSIDIRETVYAEADAAAHFKKFKVINYRQIKDHELDMDSPIGLLGYVLKHIYERDIMPFISVIIDNLRLLAQSGYRNHVSLLLQYVVIKGEAYDRKALIKLATERVPSNLGEMIMDFRQESINEGLQIGLQKGLQKGLQEGIQKGHLEEKLEVAKRLLEEGSTAAFVVKVTALPLKKILELAEFI